MSRLFSGISGQAQMRGFTLIELLITLAVIALLVGVGVPMYGSFTRESSVSGATSELIAAISDSRSKAVSGRILIRLEAIDGNWANGWQSVRVGDPLDDSDDDVLFVVRRNDGGTVSIVEAGGALNIQFDREGRASAREFEIALSAPQQGDPGRVLSINTLGRVQIEKTTAEVP